MSGSEVWAAGGEEFVKNGAAGVWKRIVVKVDGEGLTGWRGVSYCPSLPIESATRGATLGLSCRMIGAERQARSLEGESG